MQIKLLARCVSSHDSYLLLEQWQHGVPVLATWMMRMRKRMIITLRCALRRKRKNVQRAAPMMRSTSTRRGWTRTPTVTGRIREGESSWQKVHSLTVLALLVWDLSSLSLSVCAQCFSNPKPPIAFSGDVEAHLHNETKVKDQSRGTKPPVGQHGGVRRQENLRWASELSFAEGSGHWQDQINQLQRQLEFSTSMCQTLLQDQQVSRHILSVWTWFWQELLVDVLVWFRMECLHVHIWALRPKFRISDWLVYSQVFSIFQHSKMETVWLQLYSPVWQTSFILS